MRVWDVHPGYLSNRGLLGQHAEIHAVFRIIGSNKTGYSSHPETLRWKNNLARLMAHHDLAVKEMVLRRFNHNSPITFFNETKCVNLGYVDTPARQFEILHEKYRRKGQSGRIPLPQNGTQFWAHHKYSILARGCRYYRSIQGICKQIKDFPIGKQDELISVILALLEKQPASGAILNTIDHLWGYFKQEATNEEKKCLTELATQGHKQQVAFLFQLAEKYHKIYLLHSTVFADL